VLKTSAFILLLVALATLIRLHDIDRNGLTSNETVTLCVANGISARTDGQFTILSDIDSSFTRQDIRAFKTYSNVIEATVQNGGNSLVYNVLLSWWTKLFGNTNTSIRLISLLFGVFTVLLGYYFCRQLFNHQTAIIAGILLCVHPVLVESGQLARAYVPATFFVLASTYSLYQVTVAMRHIWLHIPMYILCVTLSILCHYQTIFIFIAHILLVLFFRGHRKALVEYAIMLVCSLGLLAIWMYNGGFEGMKIMAETDSLWTTHSGAVSELKDTHSVKSVLYNTGHNWMKIFGNNYYDLGVSRWGILSLLLVPFTILFFVFRKIRKSEYFRPVMFLAFPFVIQTFAAIVVGLRSGSIIAYDIRYATWVMPIACLLLAFGIARMINEKHEWIRTLGYAFGVVTLLLMLLSCYPQLVNSRLVKKADTFAYHNAADFIENQSKETDRVFFNNKKDAVLTNFYVNRDVTVKQFINPLVDEHSVVIITPERRITYPLDRERH
jgi:hypothetical protein